MTDTSAKVTFEMGAPATVATRAGVAPNRLAMNQSCLRHLGPGIISPDARSSLYVHYGARSAGESAVSNPLPYEQGAPPPRCHRAAGVDPSECIGEWPGPSLLELYFDVMYWIVTPDGPRLCINFADVPADFAREVGIADEPVRAIEELGRCIAM